MKRGKPMKQIALFAAILVSGWAFAQAPVPKPAAEPAKPVAEAPKPVKKSRRSEDARKCLEEPNNNAIIKCAEAYL